MFSVTLRSITFATDKEHLLRLKSRRRGFLRWLQHYLITLKERWTYVDKLHFNLFFFGYVGSGWVIVSTTCARRPPQEMSCGGGRSRIKSHLADYSAAKNHTSPYYIYTAATINPMAAAMRCACPWSLSACGAGHTLLSSKEKGSCGAVALME